MMAMNHRVTMDWMGSFVVTLADLFPESPRAVIVGVNPAPSSVEAGHYHRGRLGQRPRHRLTRCGLLDVAEGQWEDDAAVAAGFGFTDVVKRPTASADGLLEREREHGAALLLEQLRAVGPATVIFTFKDAAQAMLGSVRGRGWLEGATLEGAGVFVMPGPYEARLRVDASLAALADRLW
jgi:TDG/mug DNA glycosylase family protein